MKPKRLALYVAGAAIAVSAAYFFWPDLITAVAHPRKEPASTAKSRQGVKARAKAKARAACAAGARHGRRGGGSRHADDPVWRRALSSRSPTSPSSRASTARSSRCRSRKATSSKPGQRPVPARRSHGQGADRAGRGEHRQRPGHPARRRGHAGPAPVSDRQQDRHRSRARSGPLRRRGPQGQHRRRAGTARHAEDAARLPHHPRADQRPHRQPERQARRHGAQPGCAAALVTINQTKPIQVSFSLPQSELGALRRALAAKSTCRGQGPRRQQADGGARATIAFVDNQVDQTTGTIGVKVLAENADEALWPGQSVEVALTVEVKPEMLSVPACAVLPAQQGMIAWVVGADNKVSAAHGYGRAHRRPDGLPVRRPEGRRACGHRRTDPARARRHCRIEEPRRNPAAACHRGTAPERQRMSSKGRAPCAFRRCASAGR